MVSESMKKNALKEGETLKTKEYYCESPLAFGIEK